MVAKPWTGSRLARGRYVGTAPTQPKGNAGGTGGKRAGTIARGSASATTAGQGSPLCRRARRRKIRDLMTSPPDLSHVRKIWVRAPNWVGDLVMATAAIDRLRRAFPAAELIGGMRPILRPMMAGTNWFDRIVETPRAGGLKGLWRQVRAMRAERFDLAVVLPNSIETALIPRLAGVPLRLGYQQGRSGLLNLGIAAQVRRRWFQRRMGPRRWATPMPHYYNEIGRAHV